MRVSNSKRAHDLSDRMRSYHFELRMQAEPWPTPETHPQLWWRREDGRMKRPMRTKNGVY